MWIFGFWAKNTIFGHNFGFFSFFCLNLVKSCKTISFREKWFWPSRDITISKSPKGALLGVKMSKKSKTRRKILWLTKLISETLAQVRGPGVQKSDRARFFGKTPFWTKMGQKCPKISLFARILKFRLYFWLHFVPKRALYGYKSDCTIRFLGKSHFLGFFREKCSRPIRSLDFEIVISREPLQIFILILWHNFF